MTLKQKKFCDNWNRKNLGNKCGYLIYDKGAKSIEDCRKENNVHH